MKDKPLNLGIVAHADAGKTTLTEQILYSCGAIRSVGSVDDGTASTDTLPIERQRGISVKTACASVRWGDSCVNLIDAPGHSDFLSEVERSLSVLDAAVLVISGVEGIQPQTRMLLESFRRVRLPCFVFINKLDRAGSQWENVMKEVEGVLSIPCLPFTSADGEGGEECRVSSLTLSDSESMENAVMACGDEAILEEYLEKGCCEETGLQKALRAAVSDARLVPVFCGASKFGLGVRELLGGLTSLMDLHYNNNAGLCARVFKAEHDEALGLAAYVRLFSGSLRSRQEVKVDGETAKITRIRRFEGRKLRDADALEAGDIGVVYGLSSVRAGALLGESIPGLREYQLSRPLMLVQAMAEKDEELPRLTSALQKLCLEDPALDMEWNRDKREVWVHALGKMQLEVLEAELLERWQLKVSFGKPSVIYKETPCVPGEGFEAYLMPKPCWAVVKLLIEPLPPGSGYQYESKVSPGRLAYRYQAHIETSLPRALSQGLRGWQVTDLKITLIDGESHNVHTHPLDFFVATPMAVMDGLRNTGTRLLEPILDGEFSAPEESLGKTISLLVAHRAQFETPKIEGGSFSLNALIPAAEAMDIPAEFAAATGGRGIYGSRFSHYEPCPQGVGENRERIGVDPLDRSRFILAARSALSQDT